MKRIIIHGLRPQFRGFATTVHGWITKSSLVKLENLFLNQEAMVKKMEGVSLKAVEEALYTNKTKGNYKQYKSGGYKRDSDIVKGYL